MEIKKPDLHTRLEKEGWRFMSNVTTLDDASLRGGTHTRRSTPIPDEEIQAEFISRGFKAVRVEVAYGPSGNLLPRTWYRGVYVKD